MIAKNAQIIAFAFFMAGCAGHTLQTNPQVEEINETVLPLPCKILYEYGNFDYVPSMISQTPESQCTAFYTYHIQYHNGGTDWDVLNIWNPLIMVGFPMSEEGLVVEGKLELRKNETDIKSFSAVCIANKTRNMFQNAGSSDTRKACLLEIKKNIDMQLKHFKKESDYE